MAEKKKRTAEEEKALPIEARAWNATKAEDDPDFDEITEVEFKEKLKFAAAKVKETGTAITNFEQEVKRLSEEEKDDAKQEGAMAVSNPDPRLSFGAGAGAMAPAEAPDGAETDKPKTKAGHQAKAASKSKSKAASSKKKVTKDESGHVKKGEEAKAEAKEQANAPAHP